MRKKIFNVLVLIQILVVCACSSKELIYHGYSFSDVHNLEMKLVNFKKTAESKQTVIQTLGSPTFIETNESRGSEFFYVENIFIRKPYIGNNKVETKILKIKFNANDQMQDFELYKTNQAEAFDSSMQTKVPGNEMKFFEQVKKNLTSTSR